MAAPRPPRLPRHHTHARPIQVGKVEHDPGGGTSAARPALQGTRHLPDRIAVAADRGRASAPEASDEREAGEGVREHDAVEASPAPPIRFAAEFGDRGDPVAFEQSAPHVGVFELEWETGLSVRRELFVGRGLEEAATV